MSLTRSTSRQAPVTEQRATGPTNRGLLLIGHGSERSEGPNRQLLGQVDRLRETGLYADVQGAVLYGEPTVAVALKRLGERPVHVVAMFMCGGLFTRKIIPARIAENRPDGQGITYGEPVGLSEGLAPLISRRIRLNLEQDDLREGEVQILLVGHGSTASDASWQATERHAARLRKITNFKSITTAYLDQTPEFAGVLSDISGPTCIVGLFIADGLHAGDDIPGIIAGSGKATDVRYLGAIGSDPGMVDLVVEQLKT